VPSSCAGLYSGLLHLMSMFFSDGSHSKFNTENLKAIEKLNACFNISRNKQN